MTSAESRPLFKLKRGMRASIFSRIFSCLLICALPVSVLRALTGAPDPSQLFWTGADSFVVAMIAGNAYFRWRLTRPRVRTKIINKIEARTRADQRKPVLYLREFSQDAVLSTVEAKDVDTIAGDVIPRLRSLTVEQDLQIALSLVGPVYAFRDPRDKANDLIPPPGVCRFFAAEDWKSDVRDRMEKASIVALLPGAEFTGLDGEEKGFVWEIRELVRLDLLRKTIIFIPYDKTRYDEFRLEMRNRKIFPALPEFKEPTFLPYKGPIRGVLYFDNARRPRLYMTAHGIPKSAVWTTIVPSLKPTFDRTGRKWRKTWRMRLLKKQLIGLAGFAGMIAGGIMVIFIFELAWAGLI